MSKNHSTKKHLVICILTFIISASVLSGILGIILMNEYVNDRERCYFVAQNEIEDIITTIDCVMARTYTLHALVKDHDGTTTFFDRIAPEIYDSVREETGITLKNIALAPNGIVEKVYPYAGNEGLIGFNFMDETKEGNTEAINAYNQGKTILTNPFDLVQGGKGMAGRTPVMVGEIGKESLWGLATVTMDYDNLMQSLNLSNIEKLGYSYEISFINDDGTISVMQSGGNMGQNPTVSDFSVRNLNWRLSIMPIHGWIHYRDLILGIIIVFIISLLIALCIKGVLRIRESNEKLRFLSYRDGLTGAYSRHYVNTVLVNMQNGAWTNPNMKYSLIIIDIDDFKHFNDNYGHDVGDRVIYMVAHALMENIKEHCGDCVIRFGGDEFIVLLNDVTRERLSDIADSICETVRNVRFDDISDLRVTISGGAAHHEETPTGIYKELNLLADEKLYKAKEKGKNQIEV